MILSGKYIKNAIQEGFWTSNKKAEELKFGPNSVDVTISSHYYVAKRIIDPDLFDPETGAIDLEKIDSADLFEEVEDESFVLQPGILVLGSVNERFDCVEPLPINGENHNFVQHYEGRSTLGRVGIQSHVTAGFGDYGFKGSFTLELINNSPWPIILKKGMRIGQVYFETLAGEAERYNGYDQVDCKPQLPRLGQGRFS